MPEKEERISAIDGLRAIAVICVIAYHIAPAAIPGGFVGVDVFFLISGYVVCGSLLKRSDETFSKFICSFYLRRVVRIYPALIAMLLVVGVASRMFIPDSWLAGKSQQTGFYAFFGLSNVDLSNRDGYFAPKTEFNPYVHTWSLAVEEQFYFIYPAILYAGIRVRRYRVGSSMRTRAILPVLCGMSLAFSAWETSVAPDRAFYLLPSRFWELGLGGMLCLAHSKGRLVPSSLTRSSILVLFGFGLLLLSVVIADQKYFPFPWAIAPVLGTVCCICGVIGTHNAFGSQLLNASLCQYVGRLSYSLYLWHWPVIVLMRWTIGMESALSMSVAVIVTLLLSVISFHFIESPFQALQKADRWRNAGLVVPKERCGIALDARYVGVFMLGAGMLVIALSSVLFDRVCGSVRLPLSITIQKYDSDNMWRPWAPEIQQDMICPGAVGRAWTGKTLFVIGDSHAGAYCEMLNILRMDKGVSIYLSSRGGTRVGSLLLPQRDVDRETEELMLESIRRHAVAGDAVLLASLRVLRVGDQWANSDLAEVIKNRDDPATEEGRAVAVKEGGELIGKLEAM